MIYTVIEEYPEYAFVVRFKLAEMQILPDLITRLTVVYCRDTVSCPQTRFMMSTLTVELALGWIFERYILYQLNMVFGAVSE